MHTQRQEVVVVAPPTRGAARDRVREALTMWGAGDFDACIAELDEIGLNAHNSDSIFLRARALLRLHKIEDAARWLHLMEGRHTDEDSIATHAMLLGNACARLENFDRANTLFEHARSVSPHRTILAETAYYHALSLWQAADYRAARLMLHPALAADQDIVSARARQLLGFIAVAEGKFSEAQEHFYEALDALERCHAQDSHLEATLLHVLSIGEAEVDLHDPQRIDKRIHAMPWTPNLVMEHVQALRHVGLAYARAAMPDVAMARFIEAAAVCANSPWAVLGFVEAAELCRRNAEPIAASGYFRLSRRIADTSVGWSVVTGEGRLVLLHLAMLCVRCGDVDAARGYLDWYHGPTDGGDRLPALSALKRDSRLECIEAHASALVTVSTSGKTGLAQLNAVSEEWRRLKYRHRFEEARADMRAFQHASKQQDTSPSTSAPATVVVIPELASARPISLTSQQDRIVRRLVSGAKVSEIANELSVEEKTVRNHLSRLYALFEVPGQMRLLALILRDDRLRKQFAA